MNFLLITGPPAVGKMTVGQELTKKLDYKLFHNHHSIDLTLNFFSWGEAGFKKINKGIRQLIFKTVAEDHTLRGFIFTLVWAFDMQSDWDYVNDLKKLFEANGWTFHIVELYAPVETRLARNKTENRLAHKNSKRNIAKSDANLLKLEEGYQMNTDGTKIQEQNYLRIDNTNLSAEATADQIIEYFGLD
ncbi:MAG: AAA family ATPase [Bacteroidota bacterium]